MWEIQREKIGNIASDIFEYYWHLIVKRKKKIDNFPDNVLEKIYVTFCWKSKSIYKLITYQSDKKQKIIIEKTY